jgi:hypothetical protein
VDELVLAPAAAAFLEVGTFVAVALAAFGLLRWWLGDRLTAWLHRHRRRGPLVGAVLGVVPGCGGAIVVMPLYLRGQVSFGTVVATLTATMGDSSFVLLAVDPALGLAVHGGLLLVGAVTGLLVDLVGVDPRPAAMPPTDAVVVEPPLVSSVGAAVLPLGLTGRPTLRALPGSLVGFWALTLSGFVVAVPVVLRLWPAERFDIAGVPTAEGLGVLGAATCVAITLAAHRHGVLGTNASPTVPEHPREVFTEAGRETAHVVTWVVVAFVGYEVLVATAGIDVGTLPSIGLIGVVVGAALGLIPGCGPQLVLTGLYAQGVVPLSTLAANALSQDGDALFPLLIADRRAALVATVTTALPGLVVGWGLVGLGL